MTCDLIPTFILLAPSWVNPMIYSQAPKGKKYAGSPWKGIRGVKSVIHHRLGKQVKIKEIKSKPEKQKVFIKI